MIRKFIIFAILIVIGASEVLIFNETIAENIMTRNESYLIFVSLETFSSESMFNAYCQNRSNCTVLDTSNQLFEQFAVFVGYEEGEYFLIIDAYQYQKFILPLGQNPNQIQLKQFEDSFHKGELSPFYASQPLIEGQIDEKCMKLVGKSYEDFLVEDEPVKIVFLYTELPFCQACKGLLEKFIKLSQQYFEKNVIRFGYIDILKNDNRFIKDEIMPYFLVYIRDNFEDPYGVPAEQFNQLEGYVQQLISDVNSTRYVQPEDEGDSDL